MSKEVFGYLDKSIKCLSTLPATATTLAIPATTTVPTETLWDSKTLSLKEWKICNAWILSLLMLNTRNPARLGINIDGIATEVWTSYISTYKKACNIAWLNAEQILQNTLYTDHTNFTDFIINMCTKWSDARALGSKINNEDFKDIIISALSESWSSATVPLYDPNITLADTI